MYKADTKPVPNYQSTSSTKPTRFTPTISDESDVDSKNSEEGTDSKHSDREGTDSSEPREFYTPFGSVESKNEVIDRYHGELRSKQQSVTDQTVSVIETSYDTSLEKTVKELSSSGSAVNINFYHTTVLASENVKVGTSSANASTDKQRNKNYERREKLKRQNSRSLKDRTEGIDEYSSTEDDGSEPIEDKTKKKYIRTQAFNAACKILRLMGFVMITGYPGDGKTSLGMELLRYFQNGDRLTSANKFPIIISEISEWKYIHSHIDLIVLFNFKINYKTDINRTFQFLKKLYDKRGDILTVVTINKFILKRLGQEMRVHEMFKRSCMVDLSSNDMKLNEREKYRILRTHLRLTTLHSSMGPTVVKIDNRYSTIKDYGDYVVFPESVIKSISRLPLPFPFGFPSCSEFFASRLQFILKGKNFFLNPSEWLCSVINTLRVDKYDEVKYAFLVCLLFSGKKGVPEKLILKPSFLFSERHLSSFRQFCNEKCIQDQVCKDEIMSMQDVFIRLDEKTKTFYFLNEGIQEATFLVYGEENPEILLRSCTLKALDQYFSTHQTFSKIQLFDQKAFFGRLVTEIENNNFHIIIKHRDFQQSAFIDEFFEHLKVTKSENILLRRSVPNGESCLFKILTCDNDSVNYILFERVLGVFSQYKNIDYLVHSFFKRDQWRKSQIYACLYFAALFGDGRLYVTLINEAAHCQVNEQILMNAICGQNINIVEDLKIRFSWSEETIQAAERFNQKLNGSVISKQHIYQDAIAAYQRYPFVEKRFLISYNVKASFQQN